MILNTDNIADYRRFLAIRGLPTYRFRGSIAEFPPEYAHLLGERAHEKDRLAFTAHPSAFDYQRDIARIAFERKRFCVFADCGLGKTLIFLDYAANVLRSLRANQCILIVSPLMVIPQTLAEAARFFGDDLPIERVPSSGINEWLASSESRIGITNYEAFNEQVNRGRLGGLIIDESSMLKSHYGKWASEIVKVGRGVEYKLACTGTPAPNDRIEFANHAVLMDAFPTVNSFLARYFINRGQTGERWELKPHAIGPFYRDLSHWSIFLTRPSVYGWKDHAEDLPPIHVHIHDVPLSAEQRRLAQKHTGDLFVNKLGGIASRSKLATVAKGFATNGDPIQSFKCEYIRDLVSKWPDESTLIWCHYNQEQEMVRAAMPFADSMDGDTPYGDRMAMIERFKSGACRVLISKPKILGFGLNLQIATRQVFSGLQDSYESFYQAVKRSNRYGATRPLNVHIPVTEIERPMIDTVLQKAKRVQEDAEHQERIFKEHAPQWAGRAAS